MLLGHPSLRTAILLASGTACLVLAAACSGEVTAPGGAGGEPPDGTSSSTSKGGGAPDAVSSTVTGFNTPCDGCPWVCTGDACVQCVQDSDCVLSGNAALTCQNSVCVCVDDSQCTDPSLPVCDVATGQCIM